MDLQHNRSEKKLSRIDFRHTIERVNRVVTPIGLAALVVMMMVVVVNVVGRALFQAPLYGAVELVQITGVFLVAFIAGYTQFKKQNVAVGIVVDRFRPRVQSIFDSFTLLLSLGAVALLIWASFVTAVEMVQANEITAVFQAPKYPYRIVWVIGLIVLGITLLVDFIESVVKAVKK